MMQTHKVQPTQSIFRRTKEKVPPKPQGKKMVTQPFCASRHTRFATRVGHRKNKARIGVDPTVRRKRVTGQLSAAEDWQETSNTTAGTQQIQASQARPAKNKGKAHEDPTALVNVPIKMLTGRINGPSSSRATSAQTKRKPASQMQRPDGINKKPTNSLAQVELNPEGFYKVRVDSGLCKTIAQGCGLSVSEVHKAIKEDNKERKASARQQKGEASLGEDMDWGDHCVDSDTEDDMLTDQES